MSGLVAGLIINWISSCQQVVSVSNPMLLVAEIDRWLESSPLACRFVNRLYEQERLN